MSILKTIFEYFYTATKFHILYSNPKSFVEYSKLLREKKITILSVRS